MKKLLLFSFLIFFLISGCSKNGDNLDWKTDLNKALIQAQKENKGILINFTGSDWCIWCKRLSDEVFSKKEFEEFASKNLVLVKVDFPRNIEQSNATKFYNEQLASIYGVDGFPTIILLDKSGKSILKTGYLEGGAENYVQFLRQYMPGS